jgi:hypothetical protein
VGAHESKCASRPLGFPQTLIFGSMFQILSSWPSYPARHAAKNALQIVYGLHF